MLYSEIDLQRYEIRKVDYYTDGRLDYADASRSTGTTVLSEAPLPSVDEIEVQEGFAAAETTPEDFEEIWRRATSPP